VRAARRVLDALYLVGGAAGAAALLAIALTIAAQVIFRQFGKPLPGADDFAGFMVAASALLPLAYAFRHGAHIRVDLILGRLSGGPKRTMEVVSLALAATMAGFLAWSMADLASDSFAFDDVAQGTVPFKLWIPQAAIAVGCALFAIALIDDLVTVLAGGEPSYARHAGSALDRAAEEL